MGFQKFQKNLQWIHFFIDSTNIYSALYKYWNSKAKIALLAAESRHLQIWLKDEYETKLQNITFYYWVIQLIDVLPAKKFSTFRVSSPYHCVYIYIYIYIYIMWRAFQSFISITLETSKVTPVCPHHRLIGHSCSLLHGGYISHASPAHGEGTSPWDQALTRPLVSPTDSSVWPTSPTVAQHGLTAPGKKEESTHSTGAPTWNSPPFFTSLL